ncbi:MAG: hypothetical protein LAO78_24160 [Acidobacteriia bacterium]|nr:hypothetical protein [Terriglobia bacterium]
MALQTYWMQPISFSNSTGHIKVPVPPGWAVRAYSVTTAYIETDDLGLAVSWIVDDFGLVPGIASGPGRFDVEARYLVSNAAATFILMIDFFF